MMLNMFKLENQISDLVLLLRLVTFNPFVPNAYFLYPLKTSDFLMFSGGRERDIGNELVNKFLAVKSINPFHTTDLYFLSILPKNIRKQEVLRYLLGVWKNTSSVKWVKQWFEI